ncbi:MAG: aminotransferase class V-fold PLP-dependent enzyme [Nitrospinota bacterium]
MDFEEVRSEFPVLKQCVYFDHAACSPIPLRVFQAIKVYNETVMETGGADLAPWMNKVEGIRIRVASLIGAKPAEIAFTANTSQGILAVANGVPWRKGDNCIIGDIEFPANVYPWRNLSRHEVEVKIVEFKDGRIDPGAIESLMDDKTRLMSLSFVEYANGFRNDVTVLGRLCRERGVYFFVDAIQGLGALELNVTESCIDFLSAGGHKWLLGPRGSGIFFCSERVLDEIQLNSFSWRSVAEPENFRDNTQRPKPSAGRFEAGTPNIGGIVGLGASIELIQELGIKRIESRILGLTGTLAEGLRAKGYEVVSPRGEGERSGILLFRGGRYPAQDLCAFLREKRIIVAVRNEGIRVSPHYYNNLEDMQKLLDVLP